ncbi:MAG: fused MFS/spermidine synthase [Gemmataceae bacterium]|nr:fused MFS/spermidine synthase [Gemmataceae bacterium]
MGSPSPAPLPVARLAGVGAVVFLANAALLVLQLVASRLLAPFIGSDLYTWTSIIGVFLTGIALGNALGGRLADRYPSPRTLAAVLVAGAVAAGWMVLFPMLLGATGGYKAVPLGPRIPLLTVVLCLPAGFALSLLTPLAIKLGLPDVGKTGRVAGLVFALSTLGCLLGNYLTGFYLIPAFTINTLVLAAAGSLLALAAVTMVVLGASPSPPSDPSSPVPDSPDPAPSNPFAFPDPGQAYRIVFLASFGGMVLELTASRLLATQLGVSLYTWTGIIGVMLAGTALGNLAGGLLADRANRPGAAVNPRLYLAATLLAAGAATVFVLVALAVLTRYRALTSYGLVEQVLGWTFALFFPPMFALGMVSPQVVRLAVPDVAHAGRTAGRVYAWSTAGAIAGTFAAGYVLMSAVGVYRTILGVAGLLAVGSTLVVSIWKDARSAARMDPAQAVPAAAGGGVLLYAFSIVLGGVAGGFILYWHGPPRDEATVSVDETNYYTIKVSRVYAEGYDGRWWPTRLLDLNLDHLLHSRVDPDDPGYFYYPHEHVQMELLRAARAHAPEPRALVIGGGGYTFPRYAKTALPEAVMDVVEIDPGVTRVAEDRLGLKKGLVNNFNMDGRQFVAEKATPGSYDLVVLDAVNDLSVPAHLLTKEFNDEVKRALKPDGVYLLTVIDSVEHGRLWKAAMATLRKTFPHVVLVGPTRPPPAEDEPAADPDERARRDEWRAAWSGNRQVWVIYASDKPLDLAAVRGATARAGGFYPLAAAAGAALADSTTPHYTHPIPDRLLEPFRKADPGIVLTDQYAPVDNLMADIFRQRQPGE